MRKGAGGDSPPGYLAAEVVVGNVQGEEHLQAWRFGEAVLQEEAVLLRAEQSHHGHVGLDREREAAQSQKCLDSKAACLNWWAAELLQLRHGLVGSWLDFKIYTFIEKMLGI